MHQLMHWRTTGGWTEKNLRRRVKDRKPEEKEAFFPPSDGVQQLNPTGAVPLTATRPSKISVIFFICLPKQLQFSQNNKHSHVQSFINIHVDLEPILHLNLFICSQNGRLPDSRSNLFSGRRAANRSYLPLQFVDVLGHLSNEITPL